MFKIFILAFLSIFYKPVEPVKSSLQNTNKPLIIMAAPVGINGWSLNIKGNIVPTNREEFIMESNKLVHLGASVIHIHPVSKAPVFRNNYFDFSLKNYTEITKKIREVNPDLCFDWCIEYSNDSINLFQKSLYNPLFGSMHEFIGGKNYNGINIPAPSVENEILRFNKAYKHGVRLFPVIKSRNDVENLKLILAKAFVTEPVVAIFHFSGGEKLEPTKHNFIAIRDLLPDFVKEVIIVCEGKNWRQTAEIAIENNFHVRVGLHESDEKITNSEFVKYCVAKANEYNRSVATPFQAKHLLGYLK